jgi:hypothetical protein
MYRKHKGARNTQRPTFFAVILCRLLQAFRWSGVVVTHVAHATIVGLIFIVDLSIVLHHVEPKIRIWPDALVTCLSAVRIDLAILSLP